jgi:hypothetical protein
LFFCYFLHGGKESDGATTPFSCYFFVISCMVGKNQMAPRLPSPVIFLLINDPALWKGGAKSPPPSAC